VRISSLYLAHGYNEYEWIEMLLWLKCSDADPDPGSGAFFTPGSGIRNGFFPDPGFRIPRPYFEELFDIFW